MHKVLKTTLVLFLFINAVFISNTAVAGTEIVLEDDFNRNDSATIANGWQEVAETTEEYQSTYNGERYAPFFLELRNHTAAFVCEELAGGVIPTRSVIMLQHLLPETAQLPIGWSFSYTPDTGERIHQEFGLMQHSAGTYPLGESLDDTVPQVPTTGIMLGVYKSDGISNNSSVKLWGYVGGVRTEFQVDDALLPFQLQSGSSYDFKIQVSSTGETIITASSTNNTHEMRANIDDSLLLQSSFDTFLMNPTQGCAGLGYTSPDAEFSFDNVMVWKTLVSEDNTPPAITLLGDNPVTVELGDEYVDPGCEASDLEDGELECEQETSDVDTETVGTYTVSYNTVDSGGLSTSTTRQVNVVEKASAQGSNIAFLHGFSASRLYKNARWGKENKLWDTSTKGDVRALAFTSKGKSIHKDIYTRDILDEFRTSLGLLKLADGYKEWVDFLDSLVEEETISSWKSIVYDWRLATNELITQGEDLGNGNISYLSGKQEVPYMISSLEDLAESSPTGKVTIVAHSNGGLVAKNLLRHLEETNSDLLEKIDTVVLVASPQLGTPKTLREVLHGTDTPMQGTLRSTLENMPGLYGLLPSARLPELLDEPIFEFTETSKNLSWFKNIEAETIDTYEAMKGFLLGTIGERKKPNKHKTDKPNILNETLFEESGAMHQNIDEQTTPENVYMVEIVGTGLWTARGVKYDAELRTQQNILFYQPFVEWLSTTHGDGTVLTTSAEAGDADDTFYFEMDTFNSSNDTNYAHATILSASAVQELIKNNILLKTGSELPASIRTEEREPSAARFEMRAYSPVDMHLYRDGKHTGVIEDAPRTDAGQYFEEELANSFYEEWVDVKYIGTDFSRGDIDVVLDGTGGGTFTLALDLYEGEIKTKSFRWEEVHVSVETIGTMTITETGVPVLLYDYDGDGVTDAELAPGGTFEPSVDDSVSFAGLRAALQSTDMPNWLRKWLVQRVTIAEQQYEKNTTWSTHVSKFVLHTVERTLSIQSPRYTNKRDAQELRKYTANLIKSLQ